jgi:hypothetical protein
MYTNALLATYVYFTSHHSSDSTQSRIHSRLNSRRKLRSTLGNTEVGNWSTTPGPSGGPVVAMSTVTQVMAQIQYPLRVSQLMDSKCTTVIANEEFSLDKDSFKRSKDAESQPQW